MIQIIGAGLGRTGTHSLAEALGILGFGPTCHVRELSRHPEHLPAWEAALAGELVDWEVLLQDYRAVVEWPGVFFLTDLVRAFPEAKVVLTVREPDRWVESARQSIFMGLEVGRFNPSPERRRTGDLLRWMIFEETFDGRHWDRAHAARVFQAHNQAVRDLVPGERLLEMHIREGWAPLCDFLGVPVPEAPFPHRNARRSFHESAPAWAVPYLDRFLPPEEFR